jgi:ADP-heptose:LPS heptosyltransferase/O-antigen ligase
LDEERNKVKQPNQPDLIPLRDRLARAAERVAGWALPGFALSAVASIALQNLVFLALAAWLLAMAWRRRWALPATPLNWPLFLLGSALLVSSLLAGHVNGSLFGLRKVGLMAVFFLTAAVAREPLFARRYLDLYIIGAAACAVWSIAVHLLGWDDGRAQSFSGDYMAAGGMYMLALILATARALFADGRARWNWWGAAALLALALGFTYTRSSWLGALAGLALVAGLKDWRLPAIGAAALVLFLLAFPHSPIAERAFTVTSKYTSSNVERRYMWDTGWKLFRDRPWLGYGVDNLGEHYGRYVHPEAIEQNPPHVHNTLLQLALNGGIPAAGAYLWWLAAALALGLTAWRRQLAKAPERAGAALGVAGAVLAFAVNGLFEFNFGTSQVITIVYFLTGLLPALAVPGPEWALPRRPRVLFLRPRFSGDVLLASTVPRLLKEAFPGARAELLTEPSSASAAQGAPFWDEVLTLPRRGAGDRFRTLNELRRRDYDAVCDLFGNPRTAQLAAVCGARVKIGPEARGWDLVYHVRTRPNRPGPRPAWEAYFDALRVLGVKPGQARPSWAVTPRDLAWAERFLAERRIRPRRALGIFAGATHPAKRWPLDRFLTVARRAGRELALRPVFVFGPAEADLRREFDRTAGKYFLQVRDLTPGQVAALWSLCAAVVSNDAFPMHLGPAVGTPTLALFGPGDPKVWFPYPPAAGHRVLHIAPTCWPCHRDVCQDNICWRELTPDLVMEALGGMMKGRRGKGKAGDKRRSR